MQVNIGLAHLQVWQPKFEAGAPGAGMALQLPQRARALGSLS